MYCLAFNFQHKLLDYNGSWCHSKQKHIHMFQLWASTTPLKSYGYAMMKNNDQPLSMTTKLSFISNVLNTCYSSKKTVYLP